MSRETARRLRYLQRRKKRLEPLLPDDGGPDVFDEPSMWPKVPERPEYCVLGHLNCPNPGLCAIDAKYMRIDAADREIEKSLRRQG